MSRHGRNDNDFELCVLMRFVREIRFHIESYESNNFN